MLKPHQRIAMIARWKPVHLGHQAALYALCRMGERVLIGVGSSNRYDMRNPFRHEETADMIRLVLDGFDNYQILPVPDLDDGPRWRVMVIELLGELDLFVTANPYVASLLRNDYPITHPLELIPAEKQVQVDGSRVRCVMARGGDWESLVPAKVSDYLKSNKLDERFRREFGLQTLALETILQ